MNIVVANLKARVVSTLSNRGPLKFSKLAKTLRVQDQKRLDNVLQDLRRTNQIHFIGNSKGGWDIGKGKVYTPMQRSF
jgi:hypothetical protein